jgi:hypothetical protein
MDRTSQNCYLWKVVILFRKSEAYCTTTLPVIFGWTEQK